MAFGVNRRSVSTGFGIGTVNGIGIGALPTQRVSDIDKDRGRCLCRPNFAEKSQETLYLLTLYYLTL